MTMDLSTSYMGLNLRNPLVASASPLTSDLDTLKHLEEKGIAAVVLESVFEEQIRKETEGLDHFLSYGSESYAEALSYFPPRDDFSYGPDEMLEHIRKAKAALSIPVIASLNGVSAGGWMDYARKMQEAGADALELNIYYIPTDPAISGADVERMYEEDVKTVKGAVTIPVAVKLSPFFSNMAHMAKRLDDAGADALVLFNRFYQPDIDLETLEVVPNLVLSSPQEMRLPLRWIAILHGRIRADLAATSGIHRTEDVLKMLMAGANVTMLASALLLHGVDRVAEILKGMRAWMEEKEYVSVRQMIGSLSQKCCPEPTAFERANYMKTLQSYR
jgi:dihydroorotate dehydrogenase (fumarate)